jgi:very-long-chain enoyl-CoA reductase
MPAAFIVRNLAYYWLAVLNISFWVFAPNARAAAPLAEGADTYILYAGVAVYLFGELANFNTHVILANLRPRGTTKRGIPKGFGFGLVACPNYLFELVSWIGVLLVTRSLATAGFCVVAWLWMQMWAVARELRYRKEFEGVYTPHLYPMTPGWALPIRKQKK